MSKTKDELMGLIEVRVTWSDGKELDVQVDPNGLFSWSKNAIASLGEGISKYINHPATEDLLLQLRLELTKRMTSLIHEGELTASSLGERVDPCPLVQHAIRTNSEDRIVSTYVLPENFLTEEKAIRRGINELNRLVRRGSVIRGWRIIPVDRVHLTEMSPVFTYYKVEIDEIIPLSDLEIRVDEP